MTNNITHTPEQIYALIAASESCYQTMTFNCRGVPMWNDNEKPMTWWTSKTGDANSDPLVRQNWGSGYLTRGCECSETRSE